MNASPTYLASSQDATLAPRATQPRIQQTVPPIPQAARITRIAPRDARKSPIAYSFVWPRRWSMTWAMSPTSQNTSWIGTSNTAHTALTAPRT